MDKPQDDVTALRLRVQALERLVKEGFVEGYTAGTDDYHSGYDYWESSMAKIALRKGVMFRSPGGDVRLSLLPENASEIWAVVDGAYELKKRT